MAKRKGSSKNFGLLDIGGGVDSIADVPGLQGALDAKAPSGHTHVGSDIAGGNPTFHNVMNTVYTITDGASVDINPANGAIQLWTLTANRTPTTTFANGQSVTLMIADGASAYTVNWSSVAPTWVGGSAPTLPTSGYAVIVLWKANFVVDGTKVGDVA